MRAGMEEYALGWELLAWLAGVIWLLAKATRGMRDIETLGRAMAAERIEDAIVGDVKVAKDEWGKRVAS